MSNNNWNSNNPQIKLSLITNCKTGKNNAIEKFITALKRKYWEKLSKVSSLIYLNTSLRRISRVGVEVKIFGKEKIQWKNKQSFLWWFDLFDSNFPLTSSYKIGIYLKTSKSRNVIRRKKKTSGDKVLFDYINCKSCMVDWMENWCLHLWKKRLHVL